MKPKFKILILEGVERSAELIEYELSKASMRFRVVRLGNRESYLQALQEFCPDLILADCRQGYSPGLMALALAQEICPETPFLFVSVDIKPLPLKLGGASVVPENPQMRGRPRTNSFFPVAGRG
jgi:CheY-like chemotaxis protein